MCIDRFSGDRTKSFLRYDPEDLADSAGWLRGDMALSLEVIFHLVEDAVFEDYMAHLVGLACLDQDSGLNQLGDDPGSVAVCGERRTTEPPAAVVWS